MNSSRDPFRVRGISVIHFMPTYTDIETDIHIGDILHRGVSTSEPF